jgi:GT2 family glycosyltransferase
MLDKLFLSGLRLNAGRRIELVLIDDASPLEAETAALAKEAGEWADVIYRRNTLNLGYLRSANKGLALASGTRFLLCNSDTRLAPGALLRLEAAMDSDPRLGLAGPMSNGAFNSPLQLASNLPSPLSSFSPIELARFDDFGRALAARRLEPIAAGWLMGFCTLIRREVFLELGPLDEGFGFGYLEEVDYAIRARRAGWKLAVVPDAFVFHGGLRRGLQAAGPNAGSQTGRSSPLLTFTRIMKGFFYLLHKYGWKAVGIPQDASGTAERGF